MTIAITISDGTNTVTLSGTDAYCEQYQPVIPDIGADSVFETLQITWLGGNATIDANLAKLERLIQQARDRQEKARGVDTIYLTVQIDSASWRSELYDGKVIATPDWIKGERALGTRESNLILQRAAWWEAVSSSIVHITNGNGTAQVTLGIYNCNDGVGTSPNKHNNWISVPAGELSGDLPAPVYLDFSPLNASDTVDTLMIGNNVYSDPANLANWYEGETGTDTTDATCSNGKFHTFSGATMTVEKSISAGLLEGGYYRVLARLKSTADWKVKPFLAQSGVANWGPIQTIPMSAHGSFYLWDLGVVKFLPRRFFTSGNPLTYDSISFGFQAIKSTTGTIDVDYLTLIPLDGWRILTAYAPIAQNYSIDLDENNDWALSFNASGAALYPVSKSGSQILLYPGRENRLYFQWLDSTVPKADPFSKALVNLQYRPRRRAL